MNIKLYHSLKLLSSLILFILFSQNQTSIAQSTTHAQKEFNKLEIAYHSKKVSAEQYFKQADSLTHQLLSEGKQFETKELVNLLDLYKEIAWSKPQYGRARISYFFLFMNNARMFKKKGASIYYAEKIAEEYKKYGEEHPLIEQLQKTKIYQEMRLYDKIIGVYKLEKKYLESLPLLLKNNKVDNSVGLNAMYILSPVIEAYIKMKDTAAVHQTVSLARKIGTVLSHDTAMTRPQMLYNDILMIDLERSLANFEHRYDSARNQLNHMEALKTKYKEQATNFIDINLIRLRLENYSDLKNIDSLRSYISKYESSPNFGKSQSADLAEFKAKLEALQGNYPRAYTTIIEALAHERDLQTNLMAESSDLLYAYTQAEHSGIALEKAEMIKKQRTLWLVIISFVATFIIMLIYLIMLYRSRKAKAQIAALNDTATMQIIELEESRHQAIREEQQRLGQDLHDGLSSTIAAIRHQLEVLSMDIEDIALKRKLTILRTEVVNAYEVTRTKSHEWFSTGDEQQELSFEKQIRQLTEIALPDSNYKKNIQIDHNSLTSIGIDVRITLLRIIQEAVTNIIKHAKAKNVDILIYEEDDNLQLMISDDGIGINQSKVAEKKSKLGLLSIRRRVQYLNGETKINSDSKGTEIMISIPISLSYTELN